jgi:hypothetical protein
MFSFIIIGSFLAASVYILGWANGFSAGEKHAEDGVETIIPEIIPPKKSSNLPARYH